MGEIVTVERKIFGKNTFVNTVDVEFKELIPVDVQQQTLPTTTVDSFFDDYRTLFYDIPPSGSENSHETILIRSSEYLGISIEELEEEIRQLREENVALRRQLFVISNPGNQ